MRLWFGLTCLVACGLPFIACSSADSESGPAPLPVLDADASVGAEAAPAEAGCSADLLIDPKNCGRCGHDCLGGACSARACQPIRLAVDRSNLLWMTIDATHVYFCESAVQRLGRVPKAGGAVELVSSSCSYQPGSAIIDDTTIFVNDLAGVRAVPKVGLGAGTLILPGAVAVASDATSLYVVQTVGAGMTSYAELARSAKPNGSPVAIALPPRVASRFAQDATTLYATDSDGIHQFAKNPAAGADAGSSLLVANAEPADLAVDSTYVYYASRTTGSVKRVTKVGGVSDVVASGVDAPSAIAVDASGIYFASEDGGLIMSCPLSGCTGDPLVLAQRQAQPYAIAVDDVAVYWITRRGGTVMRVAK